MKKMDFLAALCGVVCLGSCSQEVFNEQEPKGQRQFKVKTRTDVPVNEGRVYVMNASGSCVSLLETDAAGVYSSGNLKAGDYEVYAIGSDDLDQFTLPTQEEATAGSIIRAAGESMGDLLMEHQSVELKDGQDLSVDLELKRKMINLEEVKISEVPDEITGVSVKIESFYNGITLDGTYQAENDGIAYMINLEKGEGGAWTRTPGLMLFPSKGSPVLTISFSTGEDTTSYVFSTSEALEANHKVKIAGSYSASQGAVLTGVLISQEWGEDKTIEFNFN